MNRYVTAGIASDAANGRRVLVVSRDHTAARDVFNEILEHSPTPERVVHANGAPAIHHSNGGMVRFTTPRSVRARGVAVDTIFIDWDAGADDLATIESLSPCLATSTTGELIRA